MKKSFVWLFLLSALLLAGCASKHPATPARHIERISHAVPVSNDQTQRIVREARSWIGTPYRYGGQTLAGTDCSGMVMMLYSQVYGLQIPRSSAQQREYALPIAERELKPGDLVFFCTAGGSTVSHVGLYIGSRKMIHASSSQGVIESNLDEKYYRQKFHSAGRIVSSDANAAAKELSNDRRELKQQIKRLEKEKKQLLKLQEQIDTRIDSTYVTDPSIFD